MTSESRTIPEALHLRLQGQAVQQREHRTMDDQTEDAIRLNTAIARLADFADTYPDGEQVDGDMDLTVDDVRLVLEAAKRGAKVVEIPEIDLKRSVSDA